MPRSSQTQRQMLAVCLALLAILQAQLSVSQDRVPIHLQSVLDTISANSLRGHLSFIASDLLEGRDSPSRGLDIAAEYIAAQFRRAGPGACGRRWLLSDGKLACRSAGS
jgi:hypothetical protein